MEKKCIGIDVGGTTVKIGIFEASGALLENGRFLPGKRKEGNISFRMLRLRLRKSLASLRLTWKV